jgi:cell division septum initiation protein DivIVA
MQYTPVELRHVRIGRTLLGYKREAVENLLAEIADSFETVWRERHELADQIEGVERELEELRKREHALTQTLVVAEQAATHVKEQAKREAELIVAEAHAEARAVTRNAQGERQRLQAEVRRVEALMRAALGMIEEADAAPEPQAAWPEHEGADDIEEVDEPVAHDDPSDESQPEQQPLAKLSSLPLYGWVEQS